MAVRVAAEVNGIWEEKDRAFSDFTTLMAGNGRVLIVTQTGGLHLVQASREGYAPISHCELFSDVAKADRDVWSHPAIVGNRLFIRNLLAVYCFVLE